MLEREKMWDSQRSRSHLCKASSRSISSFKRMRFSDGCRRKRPIPKMRRRSAAMMAMAKNFPISIQRTSTSTPKQQRRLQLFTAKFTKEEFENRRKLFFQRTKQDIKCEWKGRRVIVKLLAYGRLRNLQNGLIQRVVGFLVLLIITGFLVTKLNYQLNCGGCYIFLG